MAAKHRPAEVKFRKKGEKDGTKFRGQEVVEECPTCPRMYIPKGAAMPPREQVDVYALLHERMRAKGIEPGKVFFEKPQPTPPPPPRPKEPMALVLPVPAEYTVTDCEVHTLRFGNTDWIPECAPQLERWCDKHGLPLTVWGHPGPRYPSPKFVEIDMLQAFLAGPRQWMIYIDADIVVHPLAPFPPMEKSGFHACTQVEMNATRNWGSWVEKTFKEKPDGWRYLNAGMWFCDRDGARRLLEQVAPPYIRAIQEEYQLNYWLWKASLAGLPVIEVDKIWNRHPTHYRAAWFYHLGGRKKLELHAKFRAARLLPQKPEPFRLLEPT